MSMEHQGEFYNAMDEASSNNQSSDTGYGAFDLNNLALCFDGLRKCYLIEFIGLAAYVALTILLAMMWAPGLILLISLAYIVVIGAVVPILRILALGAASGIHREFLFARNISVLTLVVGIPLSLLASFTGSNALSILSNIFNAVFAILLIIFLFKGIRIVLARIHNTELKNWAIILEILFLAGNIMNRISSLSWLSFLGSIIQLIAAISFYLFCRDLTNTLGDIYHRVNVVSFDSWEDK